MFHVEEIIGLCLIPKTPPEKSFYPRRYYYMFYVTIKILDGMVNINYVRDFHQ